MSNNVYLLICSHCPAVTGDMIALPLFMHSDYCRCLRSNADGRYSFYRLTEIRLLKCTVEIWNLQGIVLYI
jgi:hypothetical protein